MDLVCHQDGSLVAPRTGAWIETRFAATIAETIRVAPRTGAWIETVTWALSLSTVSCRPPHGGVD